MKYKAKKDNTANNAKISFIGYELSSFLDAKSIKLY